MTQDAQHQTVPEVTPSTAPSHVGLLWRAAADPLHRRSLTSRARAMLVTCFVFARLDYCNAVFAGLSRCDLDALQAVQNAAVKLVAGARKFDHVTPLLRERHWLPVQQRITFKTAS